MMYFLETQMGNRANEKQKRKKQKKKTLCFVFSACVAWDGMLCICVCVFVCNFTSLHYNTCPKI